MSLYHPMRIIEEAVTLDQLSNGRLDLGVGRGVSPAELAFHGVSGEEEARGKKYDIPIPSLFPAETFEGRAPRVAAQTGYEARPPCARRRPEPSGCRPGRPPGVACRGGTGALLVKRYFST